MDAKARELHFSSLLIDCHVDTPDRIVDYGEDLGRDDNLSHVNIPKMRAGGLDVAFFSAWIRPEMVDEKRSIKRVLQDLDAVKQLCNDYPDDIEIATSAADVKRCFESGKLAGVLCIEGGHAIEDDLGVLRQFFDLGVRYMTLTWSNNNNWADGCLDPPKHHGLTDFGVDVVKEMNRIGMMVDVSHVSEETFWDVLKVTTKPVIASHSAARAICDHPRNLWDDQIRAVAEGGGVVCPTFVPAFISDEYRKTHERLRDEHGIAGMSIADALRGDKGSIKGPDAAKMAHFDTLIKQIPIPSFEVVVDHIEHMIDVVGPDHVGLGSDFDGVPSLPVGLEDCTKLPLITEELLKRGQPESTIKKVLGENVLRLMEETIGG